MDLFYMLVGIVMYVGQIMGIVFLFQNREHKKGWALFAGIVQILFVIGMIGASM